MLNSVTVTNFRNDSIDIELFHPEKTGFLITSIDGISFADADINTMDIATIDGSQYVSSKMQSRSITLNIAFVGDKSVETLRQLSYKYFPSKKKVRLRFNTDNRNLWIEGYVEANKAEIFSENESTAITVICPSPFLRDDEDITVLNVSVEPLFEFPFSNESLDDKLIEFGITGPLMEKTITYKGEADTTGVIITLEFSAPIDNDYITIYNETEYDYANDTGRMKLISSNIKSLTNNQFDPRTASIIGCKIIISSIIGDKYIKLLDPSLTYEYDLLGAMDRSVSSWLYLVPGDNLFVFDVEDSNNNMIATIEYNTLYGGV